MTIAVITTGGTIASSRDETGVSRPDVGADRLLAGADVRVVDLLAIDSAALDLADMQRIRDAVNAELARGATGVVVLHGTDAMEETAYLVDLGHRDPRPVVFTGAQRTADAAAPDGPDNIRAALAVAADPRSRERGVLIAFGGRVLPARGAAKRHTTELDAFRGEVWGPRRVLDFGTVADLRVDVVAVIPGGDAVHLDASLRAGARGIVLAALGSGNASPALTDGVSRATGAGVPVVVSTRVPEGPLSARYGGGGGGADLVAAGAVSAAGARPGQARILLAALLASGASPERIAAAFGTGAVPAG